MKSKKQSYFPMFVNLDKKRIIVVGAGKIASRRIRTLVRFAGDITVIAPKIDNELKQFCTENEICYIPREYIQKDLYSGDIVFAATNNPGVNNDIYSVCKCMGILVNVCSDQTKCDFFFPAVVENEDLVIGITSGGKNHSKVKEAAQKIREVME